MKGDLSILLTCEHASCAMPGPYREAIGPTVLASHRGYDPGALNLARYLGQGLQAPLIYGMWSRLLVDLNRSVGHPKLSGLKNISAVEKDAIVQEYYLPFREESCAAAQRLLSGGGNLLHISVHSFTRVLAKERRTADVGILYDPARKYERVFANLWKKNMCELMPRTRLNYPYLGASDGHTTSLRRLFSQDRYFGFELEVCFDKLVESRFQKVAHNVLASIQKTIPSFISSSKL